MKVDFYLVTVVHCKKGFAKRVANLIFHETCIIERLVGGGDSLHIFTDTNFELIEDDKERITEIISSIRGVVNHRHFTTNRYTRKIIC